MRRQYERCESNAMSVEVTKAMLMMLGVWIHEERKDRSI